MIYQHNNWSGKNCPMLLRRSTRWSEFMGTVRKYYDVKPEDEPMTPEERQEFEALKDHVSELAKDTWRLKATTFGNTTRIICTESNQQALNEVTGQNYELGIQVDLKDEKALQFAFKMGLSLQLANFSNSRATQELTQVVNNLTGDVNVAELLRDLAEAWEASNG